MTSDLTSTGANDRHRFVVEIDPLPDALVRILGPFAVRQVTLTSVCCVQRGGHGRCVTDTLGLSPEQAELLGLRLSQMPWVRNVEVRAEAGIAA